MTDADGQVRAYVAAVVPGCAADRVTAVTALDAGENHDVYRLSYLDTDQKSNSVVIRVASSDRARDIATAQREAAVLDKVRGIAAPLLLDFRCDNEWFDAPVMCMQFVDGEQRPPAAADDFNRLGRVVGRLHGLPAHDLAGWHPPAPTTAAYFDARLAKIDEKLDAVRDPLPHQVQARVRHAVLWVHESAERARAADVFRADDPVVLLHGDVAGGNIVWGPDPVLIDWEYARMGDAADEIAYIFNQNDFTEPQRQSFWDGYQDGYGADRSLERLVERVRWWEPVTVLGSALFWVQLWARRALADADGSTDLSAPRDQDYHADQAIWRLDRFDAMTGRAGT